MNEVRVGWGGARLAAVSEDVALLQPASYGGGEGEAGVIWGSQTRVQRSGSDTTVGSARHSCAVHVDCVSRVGGRPGSTPPTSNPHRETHGDYVRRSASGAGLHPSNVRIDSPLNFVRQQIVLLLPGLLT